MKAVRIHAYGGPEQLVYEDAPDPVPDAGEVVVAVEAAGVNPADHKFRSGALAAFSPKAMPFVSGMDVAGRVTALGEGVRDLAIGDRVLAMMPLGGNGGYAERVAMPAAWCAPMPNQLDMVTAAMLPTPATTAVQWIEDDLSAGASYQLLVTGATGAVGVIACYVAKVRGAHVTAAVRGSHADRVRYADKVLLLDGDAAPSMGGYDGIADAVGGGTGGALLKALKPGGVLSTIATDPIAGDVPPGVTVRFFGCSADAERLAGIAAAVAAGRLDVGAPSVMPLSAAAEAHRAVERGGAGKIVLVPDRLAPRRD